MRLIDVLEKSGVKYEIDSHQPTFTAQRMASIEHEPGKFVAKPVIVKVDGKFYMCVLSAPKKLDLQALKTNLGANSVELADENEFAKIFDDCQLGAEPPFGSIYNLPTIIDQELLAQEHITFQAGTHEKTIQMSMDDYRDLVKPATMKLSY
jgi:Ala-tRNA(Pro) deacylase